MRVHAEWWQAWCRRRQKWQWWKVGMGQGWFQCWPCPRWLSLSPPPSLAPSLLLGTCLIPHLWPHLPVRHQSDFLSLRLPVISISAWVPFLGVPTSFPFPEKRTEIELVIRGRKDLEQQLWLYCFYVSGYSFLNYDVMTHRDYGTVWEGCYSG